MCDVSGIKTNKTNTIIIHEFMDKSVEFKEYMWHENFVKIHILKGILTLPTSTIATLLP